MGGGRGRFRRPLKKFPAREKRKKKKFPARARNRASPAMEKERKKGNNAGNEKNYGHIRHSGR
jgi:hypothetical protein